jgi:hypothetical protein
MAWVLDESPTPYGRLTAEKKLIQVELDQAGPGSIRDKLLEKLRHLGVAANINKWLSSPRLRVPV